MKPSILLLIILLMCFGWINATEPEKSKKLKDGTTGVISVGHRAKFVKLPPYPGKVIMCKLQIEYDSEFHDKDYYYNASSVTPFESDYLKYTGGKDNSCSFDYIPDLDKNSIVLGHYDVMLIQWRIVGLYKANSQLDCIFGYDSDLEACKRIDYR